MADKKISQLTGATTPLAGTEEVPLVQSSTTKKVTVANLTAGRSVKMDSLGLGGSNPVSYAAIEWDPSGAVTYGVELTPLLNADTSNVQMFRARPRSTTNTHTDVTMFYAGIDGLASGSTTTTAYGFRITNPTGGVANLYGMHSTITSGAGRYHIYLSGNADSYTAGNWQFAAGKGIDFSADPNPAGMTSELLNDYEEGTWTPVATGITINSGTPVWTGYYCKIGRVVTAQWTLSGGANISVTLSSYLSLPFVASASFRAWGVYGFVSTNAFIGGMAAYGSDLYFGTAQTLSSASGTIVFQV
jgi:hypothetical protein